MTRRRRVRERYVHQIIEGRQFVPHALARAFRTGCDCTALSIGLVIHEDGTPDPAARWTIEHEGSCPFAAAGVAIDELHAQQPDDDGGR